MPNHNPINILRIDASMTPEISKSKKMANYMIDTLLAKTDSIVSERDLTQTIALIDNDWIAAAFTPKEQRSAQHSLDLTFSDSLINEVKSADQIVISIPMYNFSVPANFKAWFDQIARVGETFHYTEQGPEGLLSDKPVTIFIATGGTPLGSANDFLSPYLKQLFAFIGINDIIIIAADKRVDNEEQAFADLIQQIDQHINTLKVA